MKLSLDYKNSLKNEILKLKRKRVKLSGIVCDWRLELNVPTSTALYDIKKYATVTDSFGPYVTVEVPIDKIIPLVEKNYVERAEPSSKVEILHAAS